MFNIKIGCFGDYNINNIEIIKKYCNNKFLIKDNEEIYYKEVSFKGLKYKLEFFLIDIDYIFITSNIIENFDSFVIISNYNDIDSIKNVQYYLEKINLFKKSKSPIMFIVNGKEEKKNSNYITSVSLKSYSKKMNIPFKTCTILNQKSILSTFNSILKMKN